MTLKVHNHTSIAAMDHGKPPLNSYQSRGFALVVTLSLMILLTVIAVGLLTLSTVTLRTSAQGSMQTRANANAKLALMLAIGELQKQLGPDQRVSANGAILSETAVKHPNWAGVWNSWKAGSQPADTTNPDAASEHQTILNATNSGMKPTYAAQRSDHFRSWLVSLNPTQAADVLSAQNLSLTGSSSPATSDHAVQLVGAGSLGTLNPAANHVQAGLVSIKPIASAGATGRYGWWVGDESQKARMMSDSYQFDKNPTLADRIFRHSAPGSTGTSTVKELADITSDEQLKSLPSLKSLDLVTAVTGKPSENFHAITPFSYQVLSDVREGGLKRDLTTLLERPISTAENGDEFMLYRFDTNGQERVPIQDLAAYYQLYDSSRDPLGGKGIRYTSSPQNALLPSGIQVSAPDYYASNSTNSFLREYTSLYRSPVPIKIQMVLAARAEVLDGAATPKTYSLRLGLAPAVTFWNPNNVPVVMNLGDPAIFAQQMRFNYAPFMITWNKNGYTKPVSLAFAAMGGNTSTGEPGWGSGGKFIKSTIFDMYFSGGSYPIVFEPGESRVMSYQYASGSFEFRKRQNDSYNPAQLAGYGWKSEFLEMPCSAWGANTDTNVKNNLLVIKEADNLSFKITTEKDNNVQYVENQESPGAGLNFMMIQKSYQSRATNQWFLRNYQLSSRTGNGASTRDFNDSLIRKGFPAGATTVEDSLPIQKMIGSPGQWFGFLQFALMAGTELSETSTGQFGGRKFTSRPFLHSTAMAPPFIDKDDGASLYNSGWNWWVEAINAPEEAEVAVAPNLRSGYYGGGNTSTFGSTHVVQQEIPVVPPISIAGLSHAHLGGFSLASNVPDGNNPKVTAVGHGGLFPHTLQAIGNSYAHPLIPADQASTSWNRFFNTTTGAQNVTLADHSYLANKALWDEFFFSSISPQPGAVNVFERSARTAKVVAQDFFLNATPLPNRRIVPSNSRPDQAKLDEIFKSGQQQEFSNGLADKIAAYLMVEGPFNVNSTSEQAWKTVLSSLKGKQVSYLDKNTSLTAGVKLDQATTTGTPVGFSSLPNGKPVKSSDSNFDSSDQWTSWREFTDQEIAELAGAIVRQVKLRGPFLSLSEFVNRRLDSSKEELSLKGALQAALDDPAVSINSRFRNATRSFSGTEITNVETKFKKALEGPVAYGSAAYVDQADVLRNLSEQLTPRGDTFVIRAYGDSLDAQGKVQARAWCEAVVQRIPDYLDSIDEPHLKQAALSSSVNKSFGRKFQIISLRWLSPSEV